MERIDKEQDVSFQEEVIKGAAVTCYGGELGLHLFCNGPGSTSLYRRPSPGGSDTVCTHNLTGFGRCSYS